MRWVRRLVVNALVPLCLASASPARAQTSTAPETEESIDDPKLERRLGARVDLGGTTAVPAAVAPEDTASTSTSSGAPSGDWAAAPGAPTEGDGGPTPEQTSTPHTAHLVVSYRRFSFAQVGPALMPGPGADEPFDVLSLDLYPISSSWRFGLSTQYGWQEGTFRQGGDAFIAEAISLGGQIPGPVFTPFFEAYAGGGYMQRTRAGLNLNSIASAYGQLGVDVGSQVFLAPHFCLSAAVGFLRATNGYLQHNNFTSFSVDALTFKLGVGL